MLRFIKNWWAARTLLKEEQEEQRGYEWAYLELLAGRETAMSIDLWADKEYATPFDKGCIQAIWHLISIGAIKDTTL